MVYKRNVVGILYCVVFMVLLSCGPKQKKEIEVPDRVILENLEKAYVYGFPVVVMDLTRRQMTSPAAGASYAPANRFRHNADFPDASFKSVVRPNADTYYSIAWLDLEKEPVVLSLPDTKGRYYMMPMMDAFSNVFASPGTRATGNKAGNFLVAGPQWSGEIPTGMKRIMAPTNTVWIIGRTQVNSKSDGARFVVPLQRQYKISPLSAWEKSDVVPDRPSRDSIQEGDPNTIVRNMPVDVYFNYLNKLLGKNPPPAADSSAIKSFDKVGVGPGKKFDLNAFDFATMTLIKSIPEKVFSNIANEKSSSPNLVNGWNLGREVIGTYGIDYASRASTAYGGLGANLREDAIYPGCFVDADGNPLSGTNRYIIHFEKGNTPPANAFWSLTIYDPEGYFVDNPINRYTLGDRSNLKSNADGSIDIYLQHDDPGKEKISNWLPTPAGAFNLLLRVYWPRQEMIEKRWTPPPVVKSK